MSEIELKDSLVAEWRASKDGDEKIVSFPVKEMKVFKDGDAWCFVLTDFQNLQVSPSVWRNDGLFDYIYEKLIQDGKNGGGD